MNEESLRVLCLPLGLCLLTIWSIDQSAIGSGEATEYINPRLPISTRSEPTSSLFGLDTNDIPSASGCKTWSEPPRQHIASRKFSSDTPKHLFSNPKVGLHQKNKLLPLSFSSSCLCVLSVLARRNRLVRFRMAANSSLGTTTSAQLDADVLYGRRGQILQRRKEVKAQTLKEMKHP